MNKYLIPMFAILMAIVFTAGGCDSKRERANFRPIGDRSSNKTKPSAPNQQTNISEIIQKAKDGDAQAQFLLYQCYLDGKGVPQNTNEAVNWCFKSAKQGYPPAQNAMGIIFEKGIGGVEQNYNNALKWYSLAARANYPGAQESVTRLSLPADMENINGLTEETDRVFREIEEAERNREIDEQLKHIFVK